MRHHTKNKGRAVLFIVAVLALVIMTGCIISLVNYYSSKARGRLKLREYMQAREEQNISIQYEDMIGWLTIEGTDINYPLMYTAKENGEYYLYRNFEGEEDICGTPFLDVRCDISNPKSNLLIHGHNMKSGYMFAELLKYKDYAYYMEHPTIILETSEGRAEYSIFAAGLTRVADRSEEVFRYYDFTQYETQEEFDYFVKNMITLSCYTTGVETSYGDTLLTLSTCDYSIEDGRFFVAARRIREDKGL